MLEECLPIEETWHYWQMKKQNGYLRRFKNGAQQAEAVELKKGEEIDFSVFFDWSDPFTSKDWSVTVWAPDGPVKIWNVNPDIQSNSFDVIEGEEIEEPATDDQEMEEEEPAFEDEDNEE